MAFEMFAPTFSGRKPYTDGLQYGNMCHGPDSQVWMKLVISLRPKMGWGRPTISQARRAAPSMMREIQRIDE